MAFVVGGVAWLLPASSAPLSGFADDPAPGNVRAYAVPVATTHDGAFSLYAEEQGSGPPIVLLHGLGGSTYSWRYIAPILARTHRVIALDLKGFGKSDKAFDMAYSAADQAQLVATFLARRNLRHVTLIGHSFGGQVALMTALHLRARDPARIKQLVLIDAPALPQPLTPVVAFMQQPVLPYAVMSIVPADLLTALALRPAPSIARQSTPADARAYAAPLYAASARHAYIQTARQTAPNNLGGIINDYARVRQRTLLLWCTNDKIVPIATGRRLARIMPNAQLKELSGCNHAPTDEAPDALVGALTRFLNH
jgi:pimeloyl-ACP methyl ester carboxylesterase